MRSASSGLRHPASASCLGRHSRLAGRCPNNSSLFPPLAAVVVVAAEKLFYNFGIPERLRTLRYSIFTGGVGTNSLSQSLTALPAPSRREPLARPGTLHFRRKLSRHAKGPISEDDFPRPMPDAPKGEYPLPSCRCASSHLPQGDGFSRWRQTFPPCQRPHLRGRLPPAGGRCHRR